MTKSNKKVNKKGVYKKIALLVMNRYKDIKGQNRYF